MQYKLSPGAKPLLAFPMAAFLSFAPAEGASAGPLLFLAAAEAGPESSAAPLPALALLAAWPLFEPGPDLALPLVGRGSSSLRVRFLPACAWNRQAFSNSSALMETLMTVMTILSICAMCVKCIASILQ